MLDMHEVLRTRFAWYNRWHKDPFANTVTWGLFLMFALSFTSVLLSTISMTMTEIDPRYQVSGVGAADDMRAKAERDVLGKLKDINDRSLARLSEHNKRSNGSSLVALRTALTERKEMLTELARTNPKEVRRFVLDESVVGSIPDAARDLVEVPFKKEGTYHVVLVTESYNELGESGYEEYVLEVSDTESYRLALTPDEAYGLAPESKIVITGALLEESFVVPTGTGIIESGTEPAVLGASTIKEVAIVPFNFRNNGAIPLSVADIRARVFTGASSVNALYKEMSYGQWELTGRDRVDGDVYDWVTIDADAGNCAYTTWKNLADQALAARGVSLAGYDNVQYVFPTANSGCSWAGLAYLNGSVSWVRAENINAYISGHELGHNYGWHHAGNYGTCTVAESTNPSTCASAEYGDSHDVMGGAGRHTNAYNKAKYWFNPEQIITVTDSGRYMIEPTEVDDGTGVQTLRIRRPYTYSLGGSTMHMTNGYYQLEFRRPYGFDSFSSTDPAVNGVTVRLNGDYVTGGQRTQRVSILGVGQSLVDTAAGITIRTLSVSDAGAEVEITTVTAPCVRSAPTVTVTPSGQWGSAGGSLGYTMSVRNNDSETCGASVFDIAPILPEGFTQSPAAPTMTVNPLENRAVSFTVAAPNTALPGSYLFSEVVSNRAATGYTNTAGGNYNIALPDTIPPTMSITSPTNGSAVSGSKVPVTVTAADQSGVGSLEIHINGSRVKSCSGVTTCTYNWNARKARAGTYTITAVGIDNSPNRNQSEAQITVTR